MLLISSRFRVVVCIVTSLAVFLSVFGLSIDNALVADDWGFLYSVSKTETVRNLFHLLDFQTSWFVRPTQWFLTWLLHTCFELRVALYHLASVLLHLTNLVLLGFLVYRLLVDHNLRGGGITTFLRFAYLHSTRSTGGITRQCSGIPLSMRNCLLYFGLPRY